MHVFVLISLIINISPYHKGYKVPQINLQTLVPNILVQNRVKFFLPQL